MVKELVVRESLTEEMISAGASLTKRLDEENLDIKGSFWFLETEKESWELVIVSPLVESEGPRSLYEKVVQANKKAGESESIIPLNNIEVVSERNELVNLLRTAISTGDGISGIRFTRNAIDGHFIEDAYIYRLNVAKSRAA